MLKGEEIMPQSADRQAKWLASETILIIDDDMYVRDALETFLNASGYQTVVAAEASTALQLVASNNIVVAVIDLHLPGVSGLDVLRSIHAEDSTIQCIMLTGYGSMETAVEALREQAYDYIIKTSSLSSIERVIARATEFTRLLRDKHASDVALAQRTQELSTSLEALRETQERLLRTGTAALIGQLAEGLRHELGNALTVIHLNLNLLTHYREDEERFTRHMESLERGMRDIERVTQAFHDFPKTDANPGELVDLASVVQEAAQQAIQMKNRSDVKVTVDLVEPAMVHGASLQLWRALINIIDNAVEVASEVKISMSADGESWCVTVSDNGPGLTPDALAHATEPGFTSKIDRGFMRGLGLGLFVSSSVFDSHGGSLTLSNEPKGGARIEVRLPKAAEPTEAPQQD
jgi:signal transduction histidine kinase